MPARSVCLVTLSLSEAGPGRFGRQVSVTDIYHTIPYHCPSRRGARELITKPRPLAVIRNRRLNSVALLDPLRSVQFSSVVQFSCSVQFSSCQFSCCYLPAVGPGGLRSVAYHTYTIPYHALQTNVHTLPKCMYTPATRARQPDPGNSGFLSCRTCPVPTFYRAQPCKPGVPRCVLPCRPPACSSE